MNMSSPITQKQNKQQVIVTTLRSRIVSGVLPLGSCLSSRAIRQEFGACATTTQAAIKQLVEDGFLRTEAKRGTYVSLDPPHLTTYGVLFPDRPLAAPPDGTMNSVLAYQCLARQQVGVQRLQLYFGVTGHIDDEDYQRALADIAAHRLAGLFILYPHTIPGSLLVTQSGLARVSLEQPTANLCGILGSQELFFTKALDYLAAQGRRKIAILGCPLANGNKYCQELIMCRGMAIHPHWFIPALPNSEDRLVLLRRFVHLLLNDPHDRPDCLLVSDDVGVDSVVAGIIDAGLRVGEDIEVVAHCNYPLLKPDQWPVTRLGWPVSAVLDTAFTLLERQRNGKAIPPEITIPFVFADEALPAFPWDAVPQVHR